MKINVNHLKEAGLGYYEHFLYSFKEFLFCLAIAMASLLHAIFPWIFHFDLIKWRVDRIKKLKKDFPDCEHFRDLDLKE